MREDELPGTQMPPEVGIVDDARNGQQRQHHDGTDEQSRWRCQRLDEVPPCGPFRFRRRGLQQSPASNCQSQVPSFATVTAGSTVCSPSPSSDRSVASTRVKSNGFPTYVMPPSAMTS